MMVLISFLAMNIMTKIQYKNAKKTLKTHLVCEFVILTTSSSPGEGGAGEEPRSPQDFVLVTWETIGKCRLLGGLVKVLWKHTIINCARKLPFFFSSGRACLPSPSSHAPLLLPFQGLPTATQPFQSRVFLKIMREFQENLWLDIGKPRNHPLVQLWKLTD